MDGGCCVTPPGIVVVVAAALRLDIFKTSRGRVVTSHSLYLIIFELCFRGKYNCVIIWSIYSWRKK